MGLKCFIFLNISHNKREKARNSTLIIQMNGSTTEITDPAAPNDPPRKFTFDYSYWSHDGFEKNDEGYLQPTVPHYADQMKVYNDLGQSVLDNAWAGYNTSLFAYGQTGSGKSWSIVGYSPNRGIVPIFCEEIFKRIKEKQAEGVAAQYEVQFSMLEIYNEQVRDLLNPQSNKKGGLKIRQHPKKGFYPQGLKIIPVVSYEDIEDRMEEGTQNRTVAATNMNATSSRAHTIVGITFIQKQKNEAGKETAKTALINLVDLAGSERAESTGATGDRLKEGAAINQSLSSLGNVIAALAERSGGKQVRIPYRNSVLTKLLKNALGGNSKTIMIAAISPADINHEETLSTLRYADRAKQIKTTVTVNEDPTEKLIRELKEENENLMKMLKAAQSGEVVTMKAEDDDDDDDDDNSKKMSEEDLDELRKQIEEELRQQMRQNEEVADVNTSKLKEAESLHETKQARKKERQSTAHIWNLNPDPQLSGMIVYLLQQDDTRVGSKKADPVPDITLVGLNIQKEHAILSSNNNEMSIQSCGNSKVLVNGEPVTEKEILHHNDRIMFGSSHLYVFYHPQELEEAKTKGTEIEEVNYEMAQEEIAQNSGINVEKGTEKSKDELLIQEDLLDILPMVEEANAISQELDRKVKFEACVLSPKSRGLVSGHPEVFIIMKNLQSGLEWMWSRTKFINRKYLMQEMYQDFEEGEDWKLPDERDPFTESDSTEVMIGCVEVYLESIGYMIDIREQLTVNDYRGQDVGYLNMEVVPLKEDGKEITENDDIFIENPTNLTGKKLEFVVKILNARGIPKKYTDVYCKYSLYNSNLHQTTCIAGTTNPDFFHMEKFSFNPCPKEFIDYISKEKKPLIIQVWGKQKVMEKKGTKKANKPEQTTKAIVMSEAMKKGSAAGNVRSDEKRSEHSVFNAVQQITMQKRLQRMENKVQQIRRLCEEKEKKGGHEIEVSDIRNVLGDPPPKAVNGHNNNRRESSASSASSSTKSSKQQQQQDRPRSQAKSQACTVL
ncbi:kinesin KIF28P [Paramuricea clavata]|uniref:Kinesin-like protein 6 n=1 Tax=Paramuricea clavata TaxID=317549 RepID=A0A7D9DGU7_PARCT|nr:kinesin KIF28P [Paramuricea clavata]